MRNFCWLLLTCRDISYIYENDLLVCLHMLFYFIFSCISCKNSIENLKKKKKKLFSSHFANFYKFTVLICILNYLYCHLTCRKYGVTNNLGSIF